MICSVKPMFVRLLCANYCAGDMVVEEQVESLPLGSLPSAGAGGGGVGRDRRS